MRTAVSGTPARDSPGAYIEIYNEEIRDLLASDPAAGGDGADGPPGSPERGEGRARGCKGGAGRGLRIVEDKDRPYVRRDSNASRCAVPPPRDAPPTCRAARHHVLGARRRTSTALLTRTAFAAVAATALNGGFLREYVVAFARSSRCAAEDWAC